MDGERMDFKIPLKKYFRMLYKYLKPQAFFVMILFVFSGVSIAIQLINPQVIKHVIDSAIDKEPTEVILKAALLFIGLTCVNQLFITLSTYISENVGWKAINALKIDLISHCLNLDVTYHKKHHEAEMIERIDGDAGELLNFFSKLILNIFYSFVLIIGILVLLFREDWRVGIGLTIFVVTTIFILSRIQSVAVPHWEATREKSAKFFSYIGEQLAGREDVRSSGAIPNVMYKFYNHIKEWLDLVYKAKMMNYKMWAIQIGIFAIGNIIAFVLGAYLWGQEGISIGSVYLIINYTNKLSKPIEELREHFKNLQKAEACITRIEKVFEEKSKIEYTGEASLSNEAFDIEVNNLSFGYEETDVVLDNITFTLGKGKKLGVLGRTGSGKTTLARIIARLYDPRYGEVLFEGKPLKQIPLEQLRSQIAYVTQEVQTFNASLRDNLTFFNNNISDEKIISAINQIGLGNWLNSLPEGLDTILNAGGTGLSAGELQLLVFVRTFLRDPKLIILDEAASRLDPATEELLNNVIKKLLENRTAIIIAHRLNSIQHVDEIMILEKSRIKEYGGYHKLKSDENSKFYELLQVGLEEVLQ